MALNKKIDNHILWNERGQIAEKQLGIMKQNPNTKEWQIDSKYMVGDYSVGDLFMSTIEPSSSSRFFVSQEKYSISEYQELHNFLGQPQQSNCLEAYFQGFRKDLKSYDSKGELRLLEKKTVGYMSLEEIFNIDNKDDFFQCDDMIFFVCQYRPSTSGTNMIYICWKHIDDFYWCYHVLDLEYYWQGYLLPTEIIKKENNNSYILEFITNTPGSSSSDFNILQVEFDTEEITSIKKIQDNNLKNSSSSLTGRSFFKASKISVEVEDNKYNKYYLCLQGNQSDYTAYLLDLSKTININYGNFKKLTGTIYYNPLGQKLYYSEGDKSLYFIISTQRFCYIIDENGGTATSGVSDQIYLDKNLISYGAKDGYPALYDIKTNESITLNKEQKGKVYCKMPSEEGTNEYLIQDSNSSAIIKIYNTKDKTIKYIQSDEGYYPQWKNIDSIRFISQNNNFIIGSNANLVIPAYRTPYFNIETQGSIPTYTYMVGKAATASNNEEGNS